MILVVSRVDGLYRVKRFTHTVTVVDVDEFEEALEMGHSHKMIGTALTKSQYDYMQAKYGILSEANDE